jgi:hypothetical protein
MHPDTQHPQNRNLSTADLVNASRGMPPALDERHDEVRDDMQDLQRDEDVPVRREAMREERVERTERTDRTDDLVALFAPEQSRDFRSRWDQVQIGFVDDPHQAVKQADELVAQVMTRLAETFAQERARLEGFMNGQARDDGSADTEHLRIALQRYRSFFQRLLSL